MNQISGQTPGTQSLRLAELLSALSHALDLTEGQPAGHCVRCCWIGTHIGREAGLAPAQLGELYYALLLKDLGCSSNAARVCELYLADDRTFKHDFKQIDGSLPQVLRFILSHTGLQSGLSERFRAILNIVQNGGQIARELIETRCQRGAEIARRMHFSQAVADGIRGLDEHWDGTGLPDRISGTAIPVISRIALMAQVIDVFHIGNGNEAAIAEVGHRSGTWFDPALVEAFRAVAARPDFWTTLSSPALEQAIYDLEPGREARLVDGDYLDDIATAFAQVIDAKSPFTSGHSERVTLFADMIAAEMGFGDADRRWLKRGALLHDIGKLGVSNAILDKPGKPDEAEWAAIRLHPVHSEAILKRIPAFADILPIASGHHERLDGKGYPRGLIGDEIGIETRIVTVADIFDALTADRPYRAAMPVSKALTIMAGDVMTAIDIDCFNALRSALKKLDRSIAA